MNTIWTPSPGAGTLTRRGVLGAAAGAAAAAVLSGCSNKSATTVGNGHKTLDMPTHTDPRRAAGEVVSDVPGVPPGASTLPKPLFTSFQGKPGSGGPLTTFQINWGPPPQPESKNHYWQGMNKRLNVQWKPTLVGADAYDTKLATVLSSGDLPDLVFLMTDLAVARQAIQAGAFAELSDVLGGDKIKNYPNLANVESFQWKNSAINNGIYGVPQDVAFMNGVAVYRSDWAEKLGQPAPPTNADEFFALMTSFANGRPAGSKQTWGIAAFDAGIGAFVNAMFRVGTPWRLAGSGKLTNQIETAEYKQALSYLRKLWSAGAFHPDAISNATQTDKRLDLFAQGRVGWSVASADTWYLSNWSDKTIQANPGAKVTMILPPGHDGGKPLAARSSGFFGMVSIPAKTAKNTDRLHELLKIMDYLRAPFGSKEALFLRYGEEGYNFTMKHGVPVPTTNPTAANDTNMSYTGMRPVTFFYPGLPTAVKDTVDYTASLTKNAATDPTVGLYAASEAKSAGVLGQLATNYINGIVTGRKPLSALDDYIKQWRSQGGDTLRSEYEKAMKAR